MSIQSEINRIKNNVASAYTAVEEKGGTIPAVQNSANLAAAVQSIPAGGSDEPAYPGVTILSDEMRDSFDNMFTLYPDSVYIFETKYGSIIMDMKEIIASSKTKGTFYAGEANNETLWSINGKTTLDDFLAIWYSIPSSSQNNGYGHIIIGVGTDYYKHGKFRFIQGRRIG